MLWALSISSIDEVLISLLRLLFKYSIIGHHAPQVGDNSASNLETLQRHVQQTYVHEAWGFHIA